MLHFISQCLFFRHRYFSIFEQDGLVIHLKNQIFAWIGSWIGKKNMAGRWAAGVCSWYTPNVSYHGMLQFFWTSHVDAAKTVFAPCCLVGLDDALSVGFCTWFWSAHLQSDPQQISAFKQTSLTAWTHKFSKGGGSKRCDHLSVIDSDVPCVKTAKFQQSSTSILLLQCK